MGKHRLGSAERQWGGPELVIDAEAAAEAATTPLPVVDDSRRREDDAD
ncbi:hypothetical protein FHS29_004627 [Saccharothrix tamanrassetensis]|uniref:Uncharacterized protein n=1 Tax=Saccharothrix tamanrassetensis TaxID=1051531 RepID=A0A841CL41_9PSEU|nr:hypothetical protein [Saccharothrix tamanrassetensis]MBB5958019.1 hypothetical protein [Saccharothrix tamanrassetensis]